MPLGEVFAIASEFESAGRIERGGAAADAYPRRRPAAARCAAPRGHRGVPPRAARGRAGSSWSRRSCTASTRRCTCATSARCIASSAGWTTRWPRRSGQRQWRPSDPLCLHNLAIIHYERLEIDDSIGMRRAVPWRSTRPCRARISNWPRRCCCAASSSSGWEEYEWRFRIAGAAPLMPPTDRPQWDGAPMPGARCCWLPTRASATSSSSAATSPGRPSAAPTSPSPAAPEMMPVLRQVHPAARLFQRWDECPDYAAFCPLSGLPRLHGTRLDNIPAPVPYLHADPARAAAWKQRLAALVPRGYRRIGIVWAGRPTHNNDRNRSATLAAFRALDAACAGWRWCRCRRARRRPGRRLFRPRPAGQYRRRDPGLRRHHGASWPTSTCW